MNYGNYFRFGDESRIVFLLVHQVQLGLTNNDTDRIQAANRLTAIGSTRLSSQKWEAASQGFDPRVLCGRLLFLR